jgi:hypothetical protein
LPTRGKNKKKTKKCQIIEKNNRTIFIYHARDIQYKQKTECFKKVFIFTAPQKTKKDLYVSIWALGYSIYKYKCYSRFATSFACSAFLMFSAAI